MIFKQINVTVDTFEKIKSLSAHYNVKIYELLDTYISFFEQNKDVVNADFFQKSEDKGSDKLRLKISNDLKKIISSEINRLIGFLKVQDKFMNEFKRDVMFKFSNPEEEESHPLFMEYDYIITTLKEILRKKGVDEDEILIHIKEIYSEEHINFYKESEQKILAKKLFV